MSKFRRAARVDSNQGSIVMALRSLDGFTVSTGKDDILVGHKGLTFWYEIKASDKAEIKASQTKLLKEWRGHYKIVSSVAEILEDIDRVIYEGI
jgi:hypothetical protein